MNLTRYALAATAAAAFSASAHAGILMVDFGSTTPISTTNAQVTNSPGHVAGAVPLTHKSWNGVASADKTTGVVWSDGTAAPVTVDIGRSVPSTVGAAIDWNVTSNLKTGNNTSGSGIFATDLTKDCTEDSGQTGEFGARFPGMPLGTYDVYVVLHNGGTSTSESHSTNIGINLTAWSPGTAQILDTVANTATWQINENYIIARVTVASPNDIISIVTARTGPNNPNHGYSKIAAVQIVPVEIPEPASLGLLGLGALALLRRRN